MQLDIKGAPILVREEVKPMTQITTDLKVLINFRKLLRQLKYTEYLKVFLKSHIDCNRHNKKNNKQKFYSNKIMLIFMWKDLKYFFNNSKKTYKKNIETYLKGLSRNLKFKMYSTIKIMNICRLNRSSKVSLERVQTKGLATRVHRRAHLPNPTLFFLQHILSRRDSIPEPILN